MTNTTAYRAGAIAFGITAAIGAGWLLLDDVARTGFNSNHLVSLIVLVLAIGATHYALAAFVARKVFSGLALAVLAIGASALVMVGTAGRNADIEKAVAGQVQLDADKYADAKRERDEARKATKQKRDAIAKACADGDGPVCRGAKSVSKAFDDSLRVAEATVLQLEPKPAVPGKAKALADALHTFGAVASADNAEAVLKVLLPFLMALVLEGSSAAFFLAAFPPRRHTPATVAAPAAAVEATPAATVAKVAAPAPAPAPPKPRKRKPLPKADDDTNIVTAEVLAALRKAKQPMSNEDLAGTTGRHKGSTSKARQRLTRNGQVRTWREGRKVYAVAI